MDERLAHLEQRVDELTRQVEHLRAALEAQGLVLTPKASEASEPEVDTGQVSAALPLLGRTLVAVAGAFVIRLLTERSLVPPPVGVGLGLAFASVWLVLAWRAGRAHELGATFHTLSATLIGFPLLVETSGRLGVLSMPVAAGALFGFTTLGLVVAWRNALDRAAWLIVLGTTVATAIMLRGAAHGLPLALVLWAMGVGTVLLSQVREWHGLRWPVALVLNIVLLRRFFAAVWGAPTAVEVPEPFVLLAGASLLLYVAFPLWRTWRLGAALHVFDRLQLVAALAVGLVTATRLVPFASIGGLVVAAIAVATAARLSGDAQRLVDTWFYGAVGLTLVLAMSPFLAHGVALAALWSGLAAGAAAWGRQRLTLMLWSISATLVLASTLGAGGVSPLLDGWVRPIGSEWHRLDGAPVVTFALALLTWATMSWQRPPLSLRGPPLVVFVGAVLGLLALLTHLVRDGLGGATADVGLVLLVRTLLLVGAALGAAGGWRLGGPLELRWAAWLLLPLAVLKVLLQDLRQGQAGPLVVAFLALGAAMALVPRWLKARPVPAE